MPTPKEIADKLQGVEREEYILSIQPQSFLLRFNEPDEEKAKRLAAKIPESARCLKQDGTIDLNVREITPEQEREYLEFRRGRGPMIEETRTAYLLKKYDEGKVSNRLKDNIETPHVTLKPEIKDKAVLGWMGQLKSVKEKFISIMEQIFEKVTVNRDK